jgi:signal transduction histidine kinase
MLDKLAQARNEVMTLNANLEAIVAKRTLDLKIAKEDAELANEAKSVFMSRINHELRTPLNAVLGCTQIVGHMLADSQYEKHRALLDHAADAGEHLLMLFEDIMDVVVMNQGEVAIPLEEFAIGEIIQSSVSMVQLEAEQNQISLSAPSTDLLVFANRGRLKQVLLNLLTNAIKYNRPHGNVTIKVNEMFDGQLQLCVQDTGVGIAKDEHHRIFEPLYRSAYAEKACIDGTGIGLSIVKSLIVKMNGSISVESQVESGSQFIIILPTCQTLKTTSPNLLDEQT